MLRAHADGLMDYRQYDPEDKFARARHRVMLDVVADKLTRELLDMKHRHYAMLSYELAPEAAVEVRTHAGAMLNHWWKLQMPWMAEEIGVAGTQTEAERFAAMYHEAVGRPGEARYEEAMRELERELRPVSRAEKLRRRRVRRAQAAQQAAQQEMTQAWHARQEGTATL